MSVVTPGAPEECVHRPLAYPLPPANVSRDEGMVCRSEWRWRVLRDRDLAADYLRWAPQTPCHTLPSDDNVVAASSWMRIQRSISSSRGTAPLVTRHGSVRRDARDHEGGEPAIMFRRSLSSISTLLEMEHRSAGEPHAAQGRFQAAEHRTRHGLEQLPRLRGCRRDAKACGVHVREHRGERRVHRKVARRSPAPIGQLDDELHHSRARRGLVSGRALRPEGVVHRRVDRGLRWWPLRCRCLRCRASGTRARRHARVSRLERGRRTRCRRRRRRLDVGADGGHGLEVAVRVGHEQVHEALRVDEAGEALAQLARARVQQAHMGQLGVRL
mmetsp:Transcript_2074/g.5827  ORF Transcript_2074/g.5827 Transcript_2074/m.5827 type:complete len:329 (+) Transcript_2074:2377-3363(+)